MDFATIKYSQLTPTPPPTPTQVVSRKLHSGAPFDIDLPLTGNSGVECRNGGATNDYSVVFTFPDAVTFSAAFVSGTGSVSSTSGSGTTTITVNLTGVTNAQTIGVILFGVNNGMSTSDVSVPMGVLFGDTTATVSRTRATRCKRATARVRRPTPLTSVRM